MAAAASRLSQCRKALNQLNTYLRRRWMRSRKINVGMGLSHAGSARLFGLVLVFSGLLTTGIAQAATIALGPLPYRSFENRAATPEISPFSKNYDGQSGPFGPLASCSGGRCVTGINGAKPLYFYLEDLRDGMVNMPGLTVSPLTIAPGDSVDEDDGTVNGNGAAPFSLRSNDSNNPRVELRFDGSVLGKLPTHVGVVLTDGNKDAKTRVDVYDASNTLVGTTNANLTNSFLDGSPNGGGTGEDRFFGFISPQGIASMTVDSIKGGAKGSLAFTLDHIQYGFDPVTGNAAPTADAGLDQTVDEHAVVTLDGTGSDPDRDPLSYQWFQSAGPVVTLSDPTAPQPSFVAPNPLQEAVTLTFRLTVSDGIASHSDTVNITVQNVAPTVNAGLDQFVNEGTVVTLDASGSTDLGGDALTYSWQQIEGPAVALLDPTSAQPSFIAPLVGPNGTTLTFELTVDDGAVTRVDIVMVVVQNVNASPMANAGLDQTVDEGVVVTLDGLGSYDPDMDPLSYLWQQIEGPAVALSDPTGAQPSFTAPVVGPNGTSFTFELTVDDGTVTNADVVKIVVQNVNTAPVANAGLDQTVDEGVVVTLDGSGSYDPDMDPLSYMWEQIAGPGVSGLSESTSPQIFFTAPLVARDGDTLTFQLIVDDGMLNSTPAVVNVRVKNVNRPPVADAGDEQTVTEGVLVQLNGSRSYDSDSDPLSYLWQQIEGPAVVLAAATSAGPSFAAPLVGRDNATLTFQLTVSDGLAAASDMVIVMVENVNHAPLAQAGEPQTVNEGSIVRLNGAASSDADGDLLGYRWTQISGPTVVLSDPNSPAATFAAPPVNSGGVTFGFELVVDDGLASSEPAQVTVRVQNINDPPSCEDAYADPKRLWPPDHKLVPVKILNVTDPNSIDKVTITVTGVLSDEPVQGLGDGDTSPDAVWQGAGVLLRAERAGAGNGRVYRVYFTATDNNVLGGSCSGMVTVTVPQSMKGGANAVDDGQAYDATQP
jgi:PKD domain